MRIVRLSSLFITCLALRTGLSQTDKYTNENRPYKFGFNIEGYQHRQEEKENYTRREEDIQKASIHYTRLKDHQADGSTDDKGIIKGEYGFITADGYYRVTVYATDENGDFRIISMKNIYVGFPPEDPQVTPQPPSSAGGGVHLPNPLSVPGPGTTGGGGREDNGGQRKKDPVELTGLTACSDCVIPTTKKPSLGSRGSTGGGPALGTLTREGGRGSQQRLGDGGSEFHRRNPEGDKFGGQGVGPVGNNGFNVQSPERVAGREISRFPGRERTETGVSNNGGRGRRPQNQFSGIPISDVSTGRHSTFGSVRDGLPKGVTVDDIKALLYTFNYTVGFHGHHEDGYRNGDKEGDYFFDGRDGVERKVEYIANEFGYQPNITFVDLPENDLKRPQENTEKEYGLKGYEFKWFYKK